MRIALDYFPAPLDFENQTAIVLTLENKTVFRRLVNAFLEDCADEVLTFSQEWKPFAFSKQGLYIANLLQPDADAKKLMNHVASAMEQTSGMRICLMFLRNVSLFMGSSSFLVSR